MRTLSPDEHVGRPPSWKRTGLEDPQPRLHDLTDSHAAWLIAAGAPLPVIQQRLGHEKITTMTDTYGQVLPDVQRGGGRRCILGVPPAARAPMRNTNSER